MKKLIAALLIATTFAMPVNADERKEVPTLVVVTVALGSAVTVGIPLAIGSMTAMMLADVVDAAPAPKGKRHTKSGR